MPIELESFLKKDDSIELSAFADTSGVELSDFIQPQDAVDAPVSPINELSDSLPASQRGGVILPPAEEPVPARPINRNRVDEIYNEVTFSQAPPKTAFDSSRDFFGDLATSVGKFAKNTALGRTPRAVGGVTSAMGTTSPEDVAREREFGSLAFDPEHDPEYAVASEVTLDDRIEAQRRNDESTLKSVGDSIVNNRDAWLRENAKNLPETEFDFTVESMTDPNLIGQMVGETLPQILVGLGVGWVTKNPMLGAGVAGLQTGVIEGGNFYLDALEAGMTVEEAKRNASMVGIVNGLLDATPIFTALKTAGLDKIAKRAVAQRIVSSELGKKSVPKAILKQNITEIATEITQELNTIMNEDWQTLTPEQLKKRLGHVAYGAGIVSTGMGTGSVMVNNANTPEFDVYGLLLSEDAERQAGKEFLPEGDAGLFAPAVDPAQAGIQEATAQERADAMTKARMSMAQKREAGISEPEAITQPEEDMDIAEADALGDISALPFDVAETQVKQPFVNKLKDLMSATREIDDTISKIEERISEGNAPELFEASHAEIAELAQLRADIVNEINSLPRRGKMEPIEFQQQEQREQIEIPESGETVRVEQPVKEVVGRDVELLERVDRLSELASKTKNMRLRAGIQAQIDLAQEELNEMVQIDPQDSFMGMDESAPIEERIDDMPPAPEETYEQQPQPITQSNKTKKAVSGRRRRATARYKSAKKGLDKTLTPISTRLKNIHPELKAGLRRFEANMLQKVREDGQKIRGWVDGVRKMSKEDHRIADLAMKNSDIEMLNELAGKYGLEEELQSVRGVLDELYRAGREVGFDTRYIESYFPRQVIDYKGFLEHLEQSADADILQEAYDERAKKLGKSTLTDEEKVSVANGLIRGYGAGLKTGTPRNLKGRSIQTVDEDLNQFYMSSNDALIQYVSELNETIEGRKWLGIKPKDGASKDIDEETIGAFVKDLHDRGLIDGSQQQEVIDLIGARFSRNTMNAYLQRSKNFGYLVAMGSPVNAVTQLGDLAWSIYMGGIPRTALEGARSIVGASKTTKEDVGIEHLAHEMASEDGVANLVDKTFKATGLTKIDGIGKEALMNSTFNKITKQVNSGKIDGKINDLLEQMFPDPNELQSIKEDIQNGTLSEQDEKYMKFFTLAEFQPISKSEMPENYLRHPNGRALYMLKTYTIKQFDVMRNQAIHTIKNGKTAKDKARGMKQLVELASIIMMSNAGADMLKDFILGRETPIDDIVADNLLLLIGSNKYQADQLERKGIGKTALESVAPPMSVNNPLWWDISRDTKDLIEGGVDGVEDIRTIRRVPVVGKIISSRFGYDKKVREMFEPKKKNKISPRKYSRERDTRKTKR